MKIYQNVESESGGKVVLAVANISDKRFSYNAWILFRWTNGYKDKRCDYLFSQEKLHWRTGESYILPETWR